MFFVISGYCVTASAESLRRSGRTFGEYFRRRFVRIYPPFWGALICSVCACFAIDFVKPGDLECSPWSLAMPWDLSLAQWIGSITLTGTWISHLTGESQLCFPIQSWTLCYEEQFYAVVGLLLACRGCRFFRAVAILTAAIAAVDVASLIYGFSVRGFFFDEHWFGFAAGVGLYWDLNCATSKQSTVFRTIAFAVIVGLTSLATTTTIFGHGSPFSAWRVVGALGFTGLLMWLKKYDQTIAGLNWLSGLKSCGVMCYSIYLVHLFPGKLLSRQLILAGFHDDMSILLLYIPLSLATAISLGYLFHVSVERRFLTPRHDVTRGQLLSNASQTFESVTIDALNHDRFSDSQIGKAA